MASFRPCRNPDCAHLVDQDSARKYCSDACRQRAYRVRHSTHGKPPQQVEVKFCRNCGHKFVSLIPSQAFCKASCRVSFFNQQKRIALKEAGVL
jgi:hypothetical protein